jgi:hypothetical protein
VNLAFPGCLLAVAFASPAIRAELYRGQLYCDTYKELAAIPDITDLEVTVNGSLVGFRQVPSQVAPEVALFEHGTGTVSNGEVKMTGAASTQVWRFSSRYTGRLSQGGLVLTGTQVWQGGGFPGPLSRACEATLKP